MIEKPEKIIKKRHIFLTALLAGVVTWVIDSILGYFFFYIDYSFWDLLILDVPPHELYVRFLFFLILIGFGFLFLGQAKRNDRNRIKIMNTLSASLKKLNTIFQAHPELYLLISRDGTLLEYKGQEIAHYLKPEKALGQNVKDVFPISIVQKIDNAVSTLFKTKQPQWIEHDIERLNGETTYFESRLLYYSESMYVSFTRDVTNRKLKELRLITSEQSLKERNKELQSLYQISQLQDDPNFTIEDMIKNSIEIVNQAFEIPESIGTKINYGNITYMSKNFKETDWKLSESIEIDNEILRITISHPEDTHILQEEHQFLESITHRFKIVIENKHLEELRKDFQEELKQKVQLKTEQLSIARDQLISIWENIADPILVISHDYEILFSNASAQNLFDGTHLGNHCYEKIKGFDTACDICPICPGENPKYGSTLIEQSIKMPKTDQTNIYEIAFSQIENFDGQHVVLEILRDVTYRKKTENKLMESESILQHKVLELDCLYEISTLLAQPKITIPELLRTSIELILQVFPLRKKPFVGISYDGSDYESENFKKTLWKMSLSEFIDKKPLTFVVYFTNENSQFIEKINVLEEIGDRIKTGLLSREMEVEKNRFVSIVTDSSDAIVGLNLDGQITSWNKSAELIFGYTAEEVISGPYEPLVPSDRAHEIGYMIGEIKKGLHISHFETKRRRKDGKILDISITASPIKNTLGEIIGFSAISRDFTKLNEQKNLYQDQILKSSRFKSEFMASMSHELRTPLNSIIGFSDILLEKFYGDLNDKQFNYVGNVRTSASHLLALINEILDISKIEAGKMELYLQDLPLGPLITKVKTTLKPEYEKKNLQFNVIGVKSDQIIQADPIRLQEILFNLLSNAVKYTKKGGIFLEIVDTSNFWHFHVRDSGIGIKKTDFELVFQEFQRIQSDDVATTEGTGLGLMLTKKLVELHGGNISFTSIFGEGSTFSFTIPNNREKIVHHLKV